MSKKRWISLSLVLLSALVPAASTWADQAFLNHYKAGLEAIESEEWSRAAKLMQRAIDERGEEAKRLPKYFYLKPYLPYFYLGLADFKRGNCQAALKSWNISERQGIIQRRPQYQQIELARELCENQKKSPPPTASEKRETTPTPSPPPERRPQVKPVAPPPPVRESRPNVPRPVPEPPPPSFAPPAEYDYSPQRLVAPTEPPSAGLLAAAAALLDGSYQQVIDQLAAESPADAYARAHVQLLLAAAEFALYLTSGEREADRLEKARQHVLDVRRALPDLELPERFFAPRFLDFFYGQRPQEER